MLTIVVCAFGVVISAAAFGQRVPGSGAVCAEVVVAIDQTAVLAREIFRASLGINNGSPNLIESIDVDLEFRDSLGGNASSLFDVVGPDLIAINDLDGDGQLPPGMSSSASWSIWPTEQAAAPSVAGGAVTYTVGGTIRHIENGTQYVTVLNPVPIQVFPQPKLELRYFLQRTVYSDNPFSDTVIEQMEPFSLGLMVKNAGVGAAKNFTITSAQPKFLENEKGLVVAIKIVAAQLGIDAVAPTLKVNFGDVAGGTMKVARWLLESTLQGEFTDMEVDFVHVKQTGKVDVSLIDSVSILPLVHTVELEAPEAPTAQDDDLPDFAVDDESIPAPIDPVTQKPMTDFVTSIHSSTDEVVAVPSIVEPPIDGPPIVTDTSITATVVSFGSGWKYIRMTDPGNGNFVLKQATRTGNGGPRVSLSVGDSGTISNVWYTARPTDITGDKKPDFTQRLIHILDCFGGAGTYQYDLVFEPAPQPLLTADIDVVSVSAGGTQHLTFSPGTSHAGMRYIVLGSYTGTTPGFTWGLFKVPLNFDPYTVVLASSPALWAFFNNFGYVDAGGFAYTNIIVPPNSPPSIIGANIHHSGVVLNDNGKPVMVSNAVFVLFAP